MSTRSIIARATADGFSDGIYVHFDGYPSGRGPVLVTLAERLGGTAALLEAVTADCGAGWSRLDPEIEALDDGHLGNRGEVVPGVGLRYTDAQGPAWRAEWHGGRLREDYGAEWAYALDPSGTCTVFKVAWSDHGSAVTPLAVVRLDDPGTDWDAIENAGYGLTPLEVAL